MTPRGEIAHPRNANKNPDDEAVNPPSLACKRTERHENFNADWKGFNLAAG
jgi:hypothetical protein